MPWKLILFLVFLILTTIFIGFNLDNTCTVNLVFTTFSDAPVFIVVLSSVIIGAIIAALFLISMQLSSKKKIQPKSKKDTAKNKPVDQPKKFNYGDKINLQDPVEPIVPDVTDLPNV